MTELVDLVVKKHDGSLKAEHGTGRNMAPFVAAEWGEKATAMMWRIKQLADPHGNSGTGRDSDTESQPSPGESEVLPANRGGYGFITVYRVRILRTCLPEPQCHHDTTSTDRFAAGDGRARRVTPRCLLNSSGSISTTGSRPAQATACAPFLSDRNQYRDVDQTV